MILWSAQAIRISPILRDAVENHIATNHPEEAGGFLDCDRQGSHLRATSHVPFENEAAKPKRFFKTVVDDRAPPPPRVFYHSHTTAKSVAGLSSVDKRSIPERFAVVIFAPRSNALSYRGFRRGVINWHELRVEADESGSQLARL
ncbi:hypothetical protein [Haloquadratum walsbyi]|jgi:hypothetical protein|uniref:JAB domain-containing protein n=1 Tax=Haloquadratum walsbyi J07HQW2 TaxID=1238425 RepID=U1PQL2_9EURY|nr:hypothetical protein [Haloquadratum walsbyi]ERG96057.1 MAG: hypothetical protein J07HQW2_02524 [Haloquadratum walsbyi J07HQW2]